VREGNEARNWYESGTLGSAMAKTDKQPSNVPITTHRLELNRYKIRKLGQIMKL
jgi:hypothetical protein